MNASTSTISLPTPTLPAHEHGWVTQSRHRTADGVIIYVRCAECGSYRVDRAGERLGDQTPESVIVGGDHLKR